MYILVSVDQVRRERKAFFRKDWQIGSKLTVVNACLYCTNNSAKQCVFVCMYVHVRSTYSNMYNTVCMYVHTEYGALDSAVLSGGRKKSGPTAAALVPNRTFLWPQSLPFRKPPEKGLEQSKGRG